MILCILGIADGCLVGGRIGGAQGDAEGIFFWESAHVLRAGLPDDGTFHGGAGFGGDFLGEDGLLEEDEVILIRLRLRHFL